MAKGLGGTERSGCLDGVAAGNGFLCSDFSPTPITEDMSYAFAITPGLENCCRCYELEWVDGDALGKKVQVQVINIGGNFDLTGRKREFTILTPGGGVSDHSAGCTKQWGKKQYVAGYDSFKP